MLFNDISGIILAGGKSSRLGFPKYFLKVENIKIIDRILNVIKEIFNEILIITNEKNIFVQYKDVIIVEDLIKDIGPIGGIYTGLKLISNQKAFVIASDMPFINKEIILKLLNNKNMDYDCIVPFLNNNFEVLHAIYDKNIINNIEKNIKEKKYSLRYLISRSNYKKIEYDNSDKKYFMNINTKEDILF